MKYGSLLALAAAGTLGLSSMALADHNNPWATAEDTVLSKNHDANQLKSAGTPGEDEMRGVMVRSAKGKLGSTPSGQGGGKDSGHGGGKDSGQGEHKGGGDSGGKGGNKGGGKGGKH